LTLRLVRRTHSIIDSHGLVEASVRLNEQLIRRRVSVSVSAIALAERACGAGVAALQFRAKSLQPVERPVVIVERPGVAQSAFDRRPVALGQVLQDVALLVADAALHRRAFAEHVPDRLPQCFRAVDHEQHSLLRVEAALDQIRQQRGCHGRVLGRALPQARVGSSPPQW